MPAILVMILTFFCMGVFLAALCGRAWQFLLYTLLFIVGSTISILSLFAYQHPGFALMTMVLLLPAYFIWWADWCHRFSPWGAEHRAQWYRDRQNQRERTSY